MMEEPCSFIGSDHGYMSVNPSVFFVGNMFGDLRIFLIELPVCLDKILSMGHAKTILFGINKSCLKKEFPKNVGLVLQAYLKRTKDDVKNMLDLNTADIPLNYRLCKGIYREPKEIAYKQYEEINEHFLEDLEYMFQNKIYPGIATHDKPVVDGAYKLIEKYKVPKHMYEFQMLYGVTPELRKSILDNGHVMRVYVPFGLKWFAYCTRRLKENPKMAGMIIKALFSRG